MADDKDQEGSKHRERKAEWSETCIGFWSKNNKEMHANNEERRRCTGISILHLNKFSSAVKVKNIPTTGIEIVIREGDEKDVDKQINELESAQKDEDEGKNNLEETQPKILEKVAENWGKRFHAVENRMLKYYRDPSSSIEILTDIKKSLSNGYETTFRILSYCHPQEKFKQISSFISGRFKNVSKWWKE